MKPFWQRPPKKNKKKKRKPKTTLPKTQLAVQTSKSSSWVPPFLTKTTPPVAEDPVIIKSPVTYQIASAPKEELKEVAVPSPPPQSSEQYQLYLKGRQAKKEFMKTFNQLTAGRWRSWDIWTDFVTMAACAISNAVDKSHFDEREELYLNTISKYSKEEQALFPELFAHVVLGMEVNPEQDFLGDLYTELGLNSKEHRQIFTPYHVCHLMAEMTIGDIASQVEEKGFVTIHDCCCGGGATLIAAANVSKEKLEKVERNFQHHLLITGQDVDRIVTMMCYIQLSLLGVAGYFKVGDALTEPMTENDSLENYWFTPMYFFPVWHYRRIWRSLDILTRGDEPHDEV